MNSHSINRVQTATFFSIRPLLALALALMLSLNLSGCAGQSSARERGKNMTAMEIYDRAKNSLDKRNFGRAIALYEILEVRFPFSEFTRQGQLDLMYAYYRQRNVESAIENATRFIREHPRHEKVDYAYYIRGLANYPDELNSIEKVFRVSPYVRPQDKAKKSFDAFATLLQKYPDSEWAEDARQRMVYLRNAMARYELSVANYYIRRGAYIAAANRAKKVIEEFQESDAVIDALRVQVVAYNRLGLTDLANDSKRVLDENLAQAK